MRPPIDRQHWPMTKTASGSTGKHGGGNVLRRANPTRPWCARRIAPRVRETPPGLHRGGHGVTIKPGQTAST